METIITSLTIGVLSTVTPCVLPLYPGYLAYIAGGQGQLETSRGRYFLGFFVLAGVLSMMLTLGGLIALLSVSIGGALSIVIPVADLIIVVLGVLLLLDINVFSKIPQIRVPLFSHPFVNAFAYGLLYGPIALPCSGPLLVSIFALSLSVQEALGRLLVFLWFGIGFGLPLLALSLISGGAQRWITRQLALRSRLFNLIAGGLLIGVGVYDFSANFELLKLFFSS
jgi:cytochrome c-type biogenesis protein